MTDPDIGQQFEELWAASASQARYRRGWHDMNLEEKKIHSSKFRQAMKRYAQEGLGDTRTNVVGPALSESFAGVG